MSIHLIEDSRSLASVIERAIKPYGYPLIHHFSKDVNEYKFDSDHTQIILMNTKLIHKDALSLLEKVIDYFPKSRILGINSRGNSDLRIDFLENGATDVLNYPFPFKELIIKIQSLLKSKSNSNPKEYEVKNIKVKPYSREVEFQDKDVDLKRKEYTLLEYLVRNKNRAISRNELMDNVWDYRQSLGSNTLDVHISSIRKKIDPTIIQTIHGYGYMVKDSQVIKEKDEDDINQLTEIS